MVRLVAWLNACIEMVFPVSCMFIVFTHTHGRYANGAVNACENAKLNAEIEYTHSHGEN